MNDKADARIVLYHSNDIHSRLENAARIASAIAQERRLLGSERVLAVDCGDHMDRMRQETEGSDGAVNVALLNEAGYEAATIGNNEGLTFSRDTLHDTYYNKTKFPIICANMLQIEDGIQPEWLQKQLIIQKNGLKIGLTAATANYSEVYALLGWKTTEPLEAIREQVELLRPYADIVIVISHLGLPLDKKMAEEIHGIDLILGAHTHHLLEEALVINETTICAAGKFGDYVGRVAISWDSSARKPMFEASCVPTSAFEEKETAAEIIEQYKADARKTLSRTITHLEEALGARLERESELPNLLAIGLKNWTDAEIGLVNTGQLLGGLAIGEVTAGELHALCPSPINPCLAVLEGKDLRTALEQALQEEFIYKPIKGFGFRGERLGTLAVAGIHILYDASRAPGSQIVQIDINGEPLQESRCYKVGTIDMFSFRVGYETIANAASFQFFMPEFIRNVIEKELGCPQSLRSCKKQHWTAASHYNN